MSNPRPVHPIVLLAQLPYRHDCAEWAQLTTSEQTTLDNARDIVARGGRLEVEQYHLLLSACRRLDGAAMQPNIKEGVDGVTK